MIFDERKVLKRKSIGCLVGISDHYGDNHNLMFRWMENTNDVNTNYKKIEYPIILTEDPK